MMTVLNCAVEF